MSNQTDELVPVVVAGAGPAGLLLAGDLAGAGIRTVVLEREPQPIATPKANGIVGHAAVELARRGILTGTGLRVVKPPRFMFGPLDLRLGFGPGNPLHLLPVPQRRLEQLLEARATARGAELRRGTELTGFTQHDEAVELELRTADGAHSTIAAAFLVGCDGAHSTVRKSAGIGFPGLTSDTISRIARVTIPTGAITRTRDAVDLPGAGRVALFRPNRLAGGGFSIAPAKALDSTAADDLYLISTHEPSGDAEPSDPLPEAELRASLRRVLGAELPFTDPTAARSTVGNSRLADRYRVGRVLLAGDAAHIFSAGGSALNVGLNDVVDLAPRLIAAARGEASVASLDGYAAARRPAAEHAIAHTRVQAALGGDDAQAEALRDVVGALAASRGGSRTIARLIEGG